MIDRGTTRSRPAGRRDRRRTAAEVAALLLLVVLSHGARLDYLPLVGEEGRRARSAINMIESGDWVVVQNQGVVFPDRPPMTNWLIALTGQLRGSVDLVAIRLPSVLAVLLVALLLYVYCRRLGSRFEALAAPAVFVTFGQVLQLGRLGESELVFVLFVSASLLLWHLGFTLGWSSTLTWSVGYALAALGALTKGLQAPIYFVAATAAFLLWRREARRLIERGQWIGAGVFLVIVLAWQVPYYLATDWASVVGTWFDVVGPRLDPEDLWRHLVVFPFETLGSLLPWSPLLLLTVAPTIRRGLRAENRPDRGWRVAFLVASIAVTFPSVWWSAGAKSRYFMPLYPLLAILVAMVLARALGDAAAERTGGIWRRSLGAAAVFVLLLTATAIGALVVDEGALAGFRLPAVWAVLIVLSGLAAAGASVLARARPSSGAAAILAIACFLGVFHTGGVLTQQASRRQDIEPAVEQLRARLPHPEELVSFGPIHTYFLYFWGDLIPEIPWPRTIAELPDEVEYFAFDRRPGDTSEERMATRGMVVWTTPGTLPFAWEEIGSVDCSRKPLDPPVIEVVVGRVLRDAEGRPLPVADR